MINFIQGREVPQEKGGSFDFKKYFSDETVSPFFGISHLINEKLLLKLEYDSTKPRD